MIWFYSTHIFFRRLTPNGCCESIKFEYPVLGLEWRLDYIGAGYNDREFWARLLPSGTYTAVESIWYDTTWKTWYMGTDSLGGSSFYQSISSESICPPMGSGWTGASASTFTCIEKDSWFETTQQPTTTTTQSSGGYVQGSKVKM